MKGRQVTGRQRNRKVLHVAAGGLIAAGSASADYILGNPTCWGFGQAAAVVAGLAFIAVGFGAHPRVSSKICVLVLSFIFALSLAEVAFRLMEFDFAKKEQAQQKIAPFFRQPMVPTGEAFFRRQGRIVWTGQVLSSRMQQLNFTPNLYADDPPITVSYDRKGFRNPDGLRDWEIVIAGDSFTELGHLPAEELYTTILAELLSVRVLNLGVCMTGPLTQLSYLRDYGRSHSALHAFIAFFEGNDLIDLDKEYRALKKWKATGERELREIEKQTSLLRALYRSVGRMRLQVSKEPKSVINAHFRSADGEQPITLGYAPPGRSELSRQAIVQLDHFVREYADFGSESGITVWLVFMPCKLRTHNGQVRFAATAPERLKHWQPNDLPVYLGQLADRHGIEFIDLTPALVEEAGTAGRLLYSSVFDTHLNAAGSAVVARELARVLASRP